MAREERLRTPGQNKTERLFSAVALAIGAQVKQSTVIVSPIPVADEYGVVRKTKTNPDFFLVFPDGQSMYVEVTKSSGDSAHKEAQLRVVRATNTNNYIQLTGDQVMALAEAGTIEQKKNLLYSYFGWTANEFLR